MFGLDPLLTGFLIFCIVAACAFEFINGFHDTANAVATVIYTHSLKPIVAVVWSGIMNFLGVYLGGIAVAVGIINLLPTEILIDQDVYHSIAMVLSLVLTAIIWNVYTWYHGIPCSSSHTLIGSIFGVGIAFMLLPNSAGVALNWGKVEDIGLSLLVSPIFGFGLAMFLMMLLKKLVKDKTIFEEPPANTPPPWWIRGILILTCTSVSFSHGSNDGQKGVGLMMIILMSIVPAKFAIDHSKSVSELQKDVHSIEVTLTRIDTTKLNEVDLGYFRLLSHHINNMHEDLEGIKSFSELPDEKHFDLRKNIILISKKTNTFLDDLKSNTDYAGMSGISGELGKEIKKLKKYTEYSPWWVILMISVSLGLGTMIGWKRIVITIGEKIGKSHLTYAQGATAEVIAASTIGVSTWLGLPVSTTHVLSSGVAGTMVAGKGLKNLRAKTVKSIAIAWLVTLPVTIILAGGMFLLIRYLIS
ncbi:MAG: inorganic phosphate transporter [Bacteroidales bacterium]